VPLDEKFKGRTLSSADETFEELSVGQSAPDPAEVLNDLAHSRHHRVWSSVTLLSLHYRHAGN
jgi:hypothetical protein